MLRYNRSVVLNTHAAWRLSAARLRQSTMTATGQVRLARSARHISCHVLRSLSACRTSSCDGVSCSSVFLQAELCQLPQRILRQYGRVRHASPALAVLAAPVPVDEHISPVPAVRNAAPAPVVECITPDPAVHAAPAPVMEYTIPAPAVCSPRQLLPCVPRQLQWSSVPAPAVSLTGPAPVRCHAAPVQ